MSTLASTEPFHIGIPQQVLDDLRGRLQRARRPRVLKSGGWDGGSDPDYLDELIRYWRTDYDWRRHESELNQLAHFTARLGDTHIHYVHEPALGVRTAPVLLLHGWPDSFLRYRKAIPHLINPEHGEEELTFDVVVPSLPGFGFTGLVSRPAAVPVIRHAAQLMHRLMTEVLGYETFVVAGGDGGSAIAQSLALQFPQSVSAVHLTDIGWHGYGCDASSLTDIEQQYLAAANRRFMQDGAYVMVQTSQPRALAVSLNDSPAGLASWIVDRFHSWCDSPRHLERSFSKDEMLTNVTIYWITQTIGSSIYGYLEETRQPSLRKGDYVDRPVGLAMFPNDLAGFPPRRLAERFLNVVRWSEMKRGGHFGAWECPEDFANELKTFVDSLEEPLALQSPHGHRARKTI
jgi:pimeloyl-ACP methyl ester carboxylesterase